MGTTRTRQWDAAEHLDSAEDIAAYLEAALEDGDSGVIAAALGDVARAKGMAQLARDAGLGRESLYKALSPTGNPALSTVLKVMRALGLRLQAAPLAPIDAIPDDGRSAVTRTRPPTSSKARR